MTWTTFTTRLALSNFLLGCADELAIGYVDEYGKLENHGLTAFDTARGAANFFLEDPMDAHDFAHVSTVRSSLVAQMKATSTKMASLEEELRPIFTALPKDSKGCVTGGTARYALHRLFSQRHGWFIKGLQPAGASWMKTMTVDEEVKDISKYMVPSYLQDLILKHFEVPSFDLHSLAVLAATLEHLIHAETIDLVYAVYMTLELPISGKKLAQEVDRILDTFMMVYVFGLNLDVSNLDDVTKSQLHLNRTHPAWPQIRAFAQDVRHSVNPTGNLDFDEIVRVVEKIGQQYVEWMAKDCSRLKDVLSIKPSYSKGAVELPAPFVVNGRRELFTEDIKDLRTLGVVDESRGDKAQLVIPNYINSESMCLPTASYYAACCINECEGLLGKLERKVRTPSARPQEVAIAMKTMLPADDQQDLLKEIDGLKDQGTGLVQIHSRAFALWMHRAFPLQCPVPDQSHIQKVTNPKTPDEWIAEGSEAVAEFQSLTKQLAKTLARYTTMGAAADTQPPKSEEEVSDPRVDIVRRRMPLKKESRGLVPFVCHLAAIVSMVLLSVSFATSRFKCLRCWQKVKRATNDIEWKDMMA